MRIGQRALQRVVLAREHLVEFLERGLQRLDAAGIERAERLLAAHELDRRAFLRARFREEQRAVGELERGEDESRTDPQFLFGLAPSQPARDHQMDDEKKIVVEFEDDALADAAHAAHDLAVDDVNRWIDGAEDEGAEEIEAFEALADDVAGQRFDVDNDVGKFRQRLTTND